MPPKPKLKHEESAASNAPWKSRFPVARIKKIMQADEDVGKVAQVVPVIISKALELFMESMIIEASRHTVETGHKRILPGHFKLAVNGNQMFDFLEGNVETIPKPVRIEARPADDKRTRKPRTKRGDTESGEASKLDLDTHDDDENEELYDDDEHKDKRPKLTPVADSGPRRSMSIAALMSTPSPPGAATMRHPLHEYPNTRAESD